jgi:hypothetical protein
VKKRLERQARNEALIREVNERIEDVDRRAAVGSDERFDFLCECGREGGCEQTVGLTLSEYEEVRVQDDRFAVYPGHETAGIERVVKENERYVLVDKVADAEAFVADDPRDAPSH